MKDSSLTLENKGLKFLFDARPDRFREEKYGSIGAARSDEFLAERPPEFLRENESVLRKFPSGSVEERLGMWQSYAALLARAMEQGELADDARLEAHRVWGEETRYSALNVVAMCFHAHSDAAKQRFADDPEGLSELIERLERARSAALTLLGTEDRDRLRGLGFLRQGE